MNVLDSALPHLVKKVLPTIQDTGRLLLSSDVTHIMSAIAGKPVDLLYSRLTGLSCSFFSKGWGNLKVVNFAEDLEYLRSEWPSQQLQIEWKLQAEGYQDRKPFKVYEGTFKTPCVKRVWDALPAESRLGVVQLMVPASGLCNSAVVHLAATGDQGFTRRARLAAPLLSQGVAAIILESPFYGCRKPTHQSSSKLDRVSDLLVLGWATIFESMHLLRWLEQNGYSRTGLCGTSMGGVHACLTTALYPNPIACVPFLAPRSAAVAYCDGAMWPVTAWQALLKDADDLNNDLISILETATRAHDCGVQLRPARISPNMLSQPQLPLPLQSSPTSSTLRTHQDNTATIPTSINQHNDSLFGRFPLPALPQSEWLDITNYSLWGSNPSSANSSSASTPQAAPSNSDSCLTAAPIPDAASVSSGSQKDQSAPVSGLHDSDMHPITSTAAGSSADSHQTPASNPNLQPNKTSTPDTASTSSCSHAKPSAQPSRMLNPGSSRTETPSIAASSTDFQPPATSMFVGEPVSSSSHTEPNTLTTHLHASRTQPSNNPIPSTSAAQLNAAQHTSVTVTVHHSRQCYHSDVQQAGPTHMTQSSGSNSAVTTSHSNATVAASFPWGLSRSEQVLGTRPAVQEEANRRHKMQAEAIQQFLEENEDRRGMAGGWVAMESKRMQEVADLQRHLSLLRLKAVLETFTDVTRFPVPKRTDTAILIAAKDDGYVNMESVREVHEYWRGSEMRLVPGGHVSAFLTQQNAVRQAVVDALDKL